MNNIKSKKAILLMATTVLSTVICARTIIADSQDIILKAEAQGNYGITIKDDTTTLKNGYQIYTDIDEQDYVKMTATLQPGTYKITIDDTNVKFDKKITEPEKISINFDNNKTLKIEGNGSLTNHHFIKKGNTPYLYVGDLQFNLPEQVTSSNILEYVVAKDYTGKDISDKVTYTTNYDNAIGKYELTYSVTDDYGNTHSEIVTMDVTGKDHSQRLTVEELKKPWETFYYHGRNVMSREGREFWDLVIARVLQNGKANEKITFNLFDHHIYLKKDEINAIAETLLDNDPRLFNLQCISPWSSKCYTEEGGFVKTFSITFNNLATTYDDWLTKIENNAQTHLDLTRKMEGSAAQKLYVAAKDYQAAIKYGIGSNGDNQQLYTAMGEHISVCGGNARGYIFLSQRLGIKSIWYRTTSHAWSLSKINTEDGWYSTDLLGSGLFKDPGDALRNHTVNSEWSHWFRQNNKYPKFAKGNYELFKFTFDTGIKSGDVYVGDKADFVKDGIITTYESEIPNWEFNGKHSHFYMDVLDDNGNVMQSNIPHPVQNFTWTQEEVGKHYRIQIQVNTPIGTRTIYRYINVLPKKETNIEATSETKTNIALNKPVYATSTEAVRSAASLVDGNTSSLWVSNGQIFPSEVTVDLEQDYQLKNIQLTFEKANLPFQFEVIAINDAGGESVVLDKKGSNNTLDKKYDIPVGSYVRYIKVRFTGIVPNATAWPAIAEIEAFIQ